MINRGENKRGHWKGEKGHISKGFIFVKVGEGKVEMCGQNLLLEIMTY